MWESRVPEEHEPLRQGDLIADVWFPTIRPSMTTFEFEKQKRVLTNVRMDTGIIVSQCCDNVDQQERKVDSHLVTVAPVRMVRKISPQHRNALASIAPTVNKDTGRLTNYVLEEFALAPLPPTMDYPKHDEMWVARLREALPLRGDIESLRKRRCARMTVERRRDLRVNLSFLWGRPEEEDTAILRERGLPTGPGNFRTEQE